MLNLELFLAVIENEEKAELFVKLYEKLKNKGYYIALKITKDEGDAEEAVQDGFFGLAKNIDKLDFDEEEKLEIYTVKAIQNASINIVNKKNGMPVVFDLDECFNIRDDTDIQKELETSETVKKIEKIIKVLPKQYIDVLSLHFLGDFNTKEISDMIGRSEDTVKTQLNRGKKLLQEKIKEAKLYE